MSEEARPLLADPSVAPSFTLNDGDLNSRKLKQKKTKDKDKEPKKKEKKEKKKKEVKEKKEKEKEKEKTKEKGKKKKKESKKDTKKKGKNGRGVAASPFDSFSSSSSSDDEGLLASNRLFPSFPVAGGDPDQTVEETPAERKARKSLRSLRSDVIRKAFVIAIDKLRHSWQYEPVEDGMGDEEIAMCAHNFLHIVRSQHHQIFNASGYLSWLRRNFSHSGLHQIDAFLGKDIDPSELINRKLKDIVLKETLWTLAEHIRHCPQRLNQLFYEISTNPENHSWYTKKVDLESLFLKIKYCDDVALEIKDTKKFPPPVIDLEKVKEGVALFQAGELNFDDIDDCGKYNEPRMFKTFHEAPGLWLIFVVLKYVSGMIQFKWWLCSGLYFLYKFGTPIPSHDKMLGRETVEYPAIRAFALADFGIMMILLVNEWAVRLAFTRQRYANMSRSMVLRLGVSLLQPIAAAIAFVIEFFAFPEHGKSYWDTFDNLILWYIGGRVLLNVGMEFLPYSPVIESEDQTGGMGAWKGLRKRYASRLAFFAIVTILSLVYEWFLIIPAIDTIIDTPYCGDKLFTAYLATSYSTQEIICMLTSVFLVFVTFMSLAIDNGLAFIVVMAFVGWIRGNKAQGSARGLVQVSVRELYKKLAARFLVDHHAVLTSGSDPEASVLMSADDTLTSRARKLWVWCVNYWYQEDLLSTKEKEYMLREQSDPSKDDLTIDCSLLSSPDAIKHISFFINTLDVEPVRNMSFFDIPPTTVLIPIYGEKLNFSWTQQKNYNPSSEFSHLVAKNSEDWLNFVDRFSHTHAFKFGSGGEASADSSSGKKYPLLPREIESLVVNWHDVGKEDPELVDAVTTWISMHDQYVLKTVVGAASYFYSLVQLGMLQGKLSEEKARKYAKQKCQVVLCVQIYQKRPDIWNTLAKWMKDIPCLSIVIDYDRNLEPSASSKIDKVTGVKKVTTGDFVPKHYPYATALLEYDEKKGKVVFRHVLPREAPLRIKNHVGSFIQGKSMNQLNGMTYARGQFIQVLDCNQGGHATELLKFPSLLNDFRLHPTKGKIRYRIIGSREYIFTKNAGTVARCHAYQEWSFGTLVLRAYSDLGIRLHYGHPDVIHGAWATHHSGLSKVNPDFNLSEDVFAGIETMKCNENTKHVEMIQFQKGRETGLANMSGFDTKISAGAAGVLRSRDMYHLMERLDYVTGFLLFHGLSGHFTTTSLMMISMRMYIMTLLLLSLSGASLRAFGDFVYSSEWLFHAGLTTVVPLLVEFLVEYGPVLGLVRALFFLPVSTMIYLFQMQTKHASFQRGIVTGKAAYIATGRGLMIYRASLVALFKNYCNSHFYPAMNMIFLSIAYKSMSEDLGGGTLPLIIIYVLLGALLVCPMVFNPTLSGAELTDVAEDLMNFIVWLSKAHNRTTSKWWIPTASENSATSFFLLEDLKLLASTTGQAVRSAGFHLLTFVFWTAVATFMMYPQMQVWLMIYSAIWAVSLVFYTIIFFFLNPYEQALRLIVVYLGMVAMVMYYIVRYAPYGIINFTSVFLPFLLFVKLLETLRGLALDFASVAARIRSRNAPASKQKNTLTVYQIYFLSLINKMFFTNMSRVMLALIWALLNFVVALIMRPFWANWVLFGNNSNSKKFGYLEGKRKLRDRKDRFGLIV